MESPGLRSVLFTLSMEKQGLLTSSLSVTETVNEEKIYTNITQTPIMITESKMKPRLLHLN